MSNITKGYKQTEVGVIPEDWEVKRIGEIANVQGGYAFSSRKFVDSGKYQVVKMSNLYGGNLDLNRSKSFLNQLDNVEDGFLLKENDTLITLTGTVGKRDYGYAYRIRDERNLLLNQRVARIVANEKSNPVYLYFQLKTPSFLNQFFDVAKGGTGNQANVGTKDIEEIKTPLPTKAEQTAIAAALSNADALISSLEKLIAKKRNTKQGAMQQLLKPKDNWAMKKLGDILTFSGGYSASREQLSNEGFCYLHYGDIHGAKKTFINVKNEYTEIPKLKISLKNVSPKSLLNDGDIVFVDASEDDEGTSRHLIVKNPDGIPYISGLHTIVAKSTDDLLDNDFKRYCFQTKVVKSQFKFYAVGTKVSGISKTNIAKIEIAIPPKSEQTCIAAILSDMDAEIEVLEQKLAKYRMIKQGMMQELLTGKTRLV